MASEVGLFPLTGQFFLHPQCQLDLIIAYQIQIMSAIDQAIYLELLRPRPAFRDHREISRYRYADNIVSTGF